MVADFLLIYFRHLYPKTVACGHRIKCQISVHIPRRRLPAVIGEITSICSIVGEDQVFVFVLYISIIISPIFIWSWHYYPKTVAWGHRINVRYVFHIPWRRLHLVIEICGWFLVHPLSRRRLLGVIVKLDRLRKWWKSFNYSKSNLASLWSLLTHEE